MTATARNLQTLHLYLFGTFRVVIGDQEVTTRIRPKSRSLLKALVVNRSTGLSRDALAEMLWPGSDPSASYLSLKVEAHNLRRALRCDEDGSESWVITAQGSYLLNPKANIWVDVDAFETLTKRAKKLEAGDLHAARMEYEAALALYTGEYLEDDIYEDSTLITRERLRDLHLDVLSRLALLSWKSQDHQSTISYCHEIIACDPCREDAYQLLMLSHGAMRQLSRAGAWYAVARQSLRRELDRDISKRTQDVFESLFTRHRH